MNAYDIFRFATRALMAFRLRTALMLLAMAIGVASVVVLTSLGEGARRYVVGQFSSLGTNLLIVLPGRNETTGGHPPLLGTTPRDLTLKDALSLARSSAVKKIAPVTLGSAPVSRQQKEREVMVIGSTADFFAVRQLELAQGRILPGGDPTRGAAVCVLGSTVKQELFGNQPALGQRIRISDRRFRVIGVLADQGQSLGTDLGDMVVIPVAMAQSLFNTNSMFRVLVQASERDALQRAKQDIIDILRERHDDEEDVTVITQDALLSTFDRIFTALTFTVAGIAAISLLVAGILIMNVMLVAVSQRTAEIGLLKAIGASPRRIQQMFLAEASVLALAGAVIGMAVAWSGTWFLGRLFPSFPLAMPLWALFAAVATALVTGVGFGVLPARRAAKLDPVLALSGR